MNKTLMTISIFPLLFILNGCAVGPNGSPFINSQETTQLVRTSDGRVVPMTVRSSQDHAGTVAMNLVGNIVGLGRDMLNVGMATNWGRGYSRRRSYLHNLTYPTGMFNNNWGTSYGGGYYMAPRGGIWVQ